MKKIAAAVLTVLLVIVLFLTKDATILVPRKGGVIQRIPIQISEKQEKPGRQILIPIDLGDTPTYIQTKTRDRFYVSGFDEEGNKHTVEVNVKEYIELDIGDEYYIEP